LAYSCDAQKKAEQPETRCAQTAGRSDRFFLPLLGANQRGPVEPMFDRFLKTIARVRLEYPGRARYFAAGTTKQKCARQVSGLRGAHAGHDLQF
jgi:hypothetical protein